MEAFYWSTHEARFQFTVTNLGTTELEHNTGPEVYLLGPTGPLLFFLPTILVSSRKKFVCPWKNSNRVLVRPDFISHYSRNIIA